jgi:predicted nucleic acid-binding protein
MRIFLDTNIYIIGQLMPMSSEEKILTELGFYKTSYPLGIEVIISQDLLNQILRVGKRLQGKDWASKLVDQIWCNLNCLFIPETFEMQVEGQKILEANFIPSEDIFIYLTAKYGRADYFVSGNRELLKAIADFECLTPEDFITKYSSKFTK